MCDVTEEKIDLYSIIDDLVGNPLITASDEQPISEAINNNDNVGVATVGSKWMWNH